MNCSRILTTSALLLCYIILSGCPGIVPGSKLYQGLSAPEEQHLQSANKEIYPNDVRADLQKYQSTKVAWPGIVTEATVTEKAGRVEIRFSVEHHYYDWILDYSIQQEKIFLSPRGEGLFTTVCIVKPDTAQLRQFQSDTAPGNLLIVYGRPENVDEGVILLTCNFIRLFPKEWFRTDIFDYGRRGEPFSE